jgi:hypothetical protein
MDKKYEVGYLNNELQIIERNLRDDLSDVNNNQSN